MKTFAYLRMKWLSLLFILQWFMATATGQFIDRPNILWISCEDMSPHLSFYGDNTVATPNLNRLAREGVVYDNVFTTAGVCAPSRCAIITGVNQVTAGGHNMRTLYNTAPEKTGLPKAYSIVPAAAIKAFPEYLRAQGYYCTNNVKTDYQFEEPPTVWDEVSNKADWKKRIPGQPFFAVINLVTTHESQVWERKDSPLHVDPSAIKVPPYYPDTKIVRKDMARFFSNIVEMDRQVGKILKRLEDDGLIENTIIFFWSDHGDGLPFAKRELYDRGLKVPLVIRFPNKKRGGERDTRLISSIDWAPTVLSLAGIQPPTYMQGSAFLGKYTGKEHPYVYAARDRMDSEYDRVRAIRDKRYKYIRNFHPELPPYQNIEYRLQQDMMREILALKEKGQLDSIQMKWFEPHKPAEELYDLPNDPNELHNLAADPAMQHILGRMRREMDSWLIKVNDLGAIPEKEMIRRMWNGGNMPPLTAPVKITVVYNTVTLTCPTAGASIGYKIIEAGSAEPATWQVYTKPFILKPGQQVKAVARRIGYNKSVEATQTIVAYEPPGNLPVQPVTWKAHWISRTNNNDSVRPAPIFRKTFQVENRTIKKAIIHISGLGYYELYLNNKKVGDHALDPAITRYDKRVLYVTHDVTSQLQQGNNAIGIMLGNGWYNLHTRTAWDFDKAPWRNAPTVIGQLEIEYADGSSAMICTDSTWKAGTGAIVFDGIQNGETYDARLEKKGWSTVAYSDNAWQQSLHVKGPAGILTPQLMPPIKVIDTIKAKTIKQPKPGVWIVDFGVGMAGRVNIKVQGKPGTIVIIRYGEKLNPDGTLDQKELARFIRTGDTQTDRYILKGTGTESWSPRFVYHGFQYAEITGWPGTLTANNVFAEELHTALETTGTFSCSNPLFNKLHDAARRSFLSNYHGYPTDCPHREKMGWAGDAALVAEMALYNFDMKASYMKWLDDFTDEQQPNGQIPGIIPTSGWGYKYGTGPDSARGYGPQWEGAYVIIPWQLYLYTGDTNIIRRYYAGIKRYIDYLAAYADNYILKFGIDDHKSLQPTDPPIIATGYFYQLTNLLVKMAAVLSNSTDSATYELLSKNIKKAYHDTFFDRAKSTYGNGGQTTLGLVIYQDLADESFMIHGLYQLLDSLRSKRWYFDAGVIGVKAITNALTKWEQYEDLDMLLTADSFPSFGYWIKKGATTLWQDWQGERSLNHIMFGSFTDFFYKGLVGIQPDPDKPGFRHFMLAPGFPSLLQWVKGSHRSKYGWIKSEWKRVGNKVIYTCEIPAGTTATLYIRDKVSKELGAGKHQIEFVQFD